MMWSSVEAAVRAVAAGKLVIIVDDEGREDEGDLVMAAQSVSAPVYVAVLFDGWP